MAAYAESCAAVGNVWLKGVLAATFSVVAGIISAHCASVGSEALDDTVEKCWGPGVGVGVGTPGVDVGDGVDLGVGVGRPGAGVGVAGAGVGVALELLTVIET